MSRRCVLLCALALLAAPEARAETLPGPFAAEVERVVDGDTVRVRVRVWLGQQVSVAVRLRGVDAPELRRPACDRERAEAEAARDFVAAAVAGGVTLEDVSGDKFFGRVIAGMRLSDGRDLGAALLAEGLARAYDGGTREGWCEAATASR